MYTVQVGTVGSGNERVEVNFIDKTCACRVWQSTLLPCDHALAINVDWKALVSLWYSSSRLRATYEPIFSIPSLGGLSATEGSVVAPIELKRTGPGRRPTNRKKQKGF